MALPCPQVARDFAFQARNGRKPYVGLQIFFPGYCRKFCRQAVHFRICEFPVRKNYQPLSVRRNTAENLVIAQKPGEFESLAGTPLQTAENSRKVIKKGRPAGLPVLKQVDQPVNLCLPATEIAEPPAQARKKNIPFTALFSRRPRPAPSCRTAFASHMEKIAHHAILSFG